MELVKLVTNRQMNEIDQRAIRDFGIAGTELMETAGRRVFEAIGDQWEGLEGLQVVVLCGKGNNGGDGFVVARLLLEAGVEVRVFLAVPIEQIEGDAAHHLQLFGQAGGQVEMVLEASQVELVEGALEEADLAVDALLGTGLKGAPRPLMAQLIECLNLSARPIVAVDLPSGLEANSGRVLGPCVKALITVTFGLPKIGQLFYPGRDYCGLLQLVEIGFPDELIDASPASGYLLTQEKMASLIPLRRGDAHKGSCGSVTVIAGSVGMTGAAALSADAALRAGTGRVSLGVPASLNDILEVKLTEVMTRPLPELKKQRCLAVRSLGDCLELSAQASCVALGPGLGRHGETMELVRRLVEKVELPLVLDADGLNAMVGATTILEARQAPLVLTPHIGEFARLTGLDKNQIAADPLEHARRFAQQIGAIVVLKGAPTVVALADGQMLVNPTGNAGMATAGAGDVLTGLIAGLIAQGMEVDAAACLGVFVHGRAGDMVRDEQGEWGMKAGDIAAAVPKAILELYRSFDKNT